MHRLLISRIDSSLWSVTFRIESRSHNWTILELERSVTFTQKRYYYPGQLRGIRLFIVVEAKKIITRRGRVLGHVDRNDLKKEFQRWRKTGEFERWKSEGEENFNIKKEKEKKGRKKIQPENRMAKEELQRQKKSAARTPRKGILST